MCGLKLKSCVKRDKHNNYNTITLSAFHVYHLSCLESKIPSRVNSIFKLCRFRYGKMGKKQYNYLPSKLPKYVNFPKHF